MRNLLAYLAIGFALLAPRAHAGELDDAKAQLQKILTDLSFVKRMGLHMQDEGRIFILEKTVGTVLASVNEKGLGNFYTLNQYQQLIVKFRYSSQFFEFIRTTKTQGAIAEMITLVDKIRGQRGFDDDPYSKILKSNLEQIFNSSQQLARMDEVSAEIKAKLQALAPSFGEAIALSDLGDRPKAFTKATEIYGMVKNLYIDLQQLSSSPAAFRFVLEIMGLNEFVGEYSQVERKP